MATPPDFTAGQVLTAAQMNKVGMWIVASAAVGTAVSSVTISDCFSADYDDYRVIWSGGVGSAVTDIKAQVGGVTSADYGYSLHAVNYSTGAETIANSAAESAVRQIGRADTTYGYADVEIRSPFLTTETFFWAPFHTTSSAGRSAGYLNDTTSHTSVTLVVNSGTITGGTITVYGINKG
jgi:hypothetical protein